MSTTAQARSQRMAGWWWAIPTAGLLLLMGLAIIFGGGQQPEVEHGTSYDASANGFRAAYLLLEELGYPVTRARRAPAGKDPRLVLLPTSTDKIDLLDDWAKRGGLLVLAVDSDEFAKALGLKLRARELGSENRIEDASGGGIQQLAGGGTFVAQAGKSGAVWCRAGGRAAITIYPHGDGEIWLINRPQFLTNRNLKEADNGVLLCRMATEILKRRPGTLAFDEYYHGLRDRPSFTTLLFEPPALWITIQAFILLAILLWHAVPRFGTLRLLPPPRRRSREEFLDAMAALLERKGDYEDAYRTTRRALIRDIEHDLGLPPGTRPKELLAAVSRRGSRKAKLLTRALGGQKIVAENGKKAFVEALNHLENARHEFFERRQHDR